MAESFKTKMLRWSFSFFPAYLGTGGVVTYIQDDFHEVRVKIPLNWRTRNYVGTIFGGSMLGATDPLYMLMILKILGKDYVVWDKAGSIRFKKPATKTLYALFHLSQEKMQEIRETVASEYEKDFIFHIELKDKEGNVYAEVERTIYVAQKEYYLQKQAVRKQRKIIEAHQLGG